MSEDLTNENRPVDEGEPGNRPLVLAVESSCDESALAVFDPVQGFVGEWVSSQIDLHAEYGGVVPDLASREHLRNFGPLLRCLTAAVPIGQIGTVAVTTGPGLAGCLAMGLSVAKSWAVALNVPLYGINHLRGHAYSPFIDLHAQDPEHFEAGLAELFPHLGLIVSGGNTILFEMTEPGSIRILGSTIDDAAGEALDKGAKLMGLGYPGGPKVERKAEGGNAAAHEFPRALLGSPQPDFSFSGLKTSLRYRLEKMDATTVATGMADLCASYQEAVVDVLVRKTKRELKRIGYRSLGLSGGVTNNRRLRAAFQQLASDRRLPLYIAKPAHTGDNAAMIAFACWIERRVLVPADSFGLRLVPGLPLDAQPGADLK